MIKSREDLIAFLSQDTKADISTYGTEGWRSLEELLEEIEGKDVMLFFNKKCGHVEAIRMSTKGVLDSEGYRLHEVRRMYPKQLRFLGLFRQWRVIEQRQEYAISETLKLGCEDTAQALTRGIWEEWRIRISEDQLHPWAFQDMTDRRWSRVYPRLWSVVRNMWQVINLPQRPCRWNPIIEDNGVLIYLEWTYLAGKEKWYRIAERHVLSAIVRVWVAIQYAF